MYHTKYMNIREQIRAAMAKDGVDHDCRGPECRDCANARELFAKDPNKVYQDDDR